MVTGRLLGRMLLVVAATATGCMEVRGSAATLYAEGETPGDADTVAVETTLGNRQTVLPAGRHGLKYFPDLCLNILSVTPELRLLMVAGRETYLLGGRDFFALAPVKVVLSPGPPGSIDNGYAGIGGVYHDDRSGKLLALYHAEDQEGMGQLPGRVPGFYATINLAVSSDGGLSFAKRGPVITGSLPKDPHGFPAQGCGEPSVIPDPSGKHLLAYYTDHSGLEGRGAQACLARCAVADLDDTTRWLKFHAGRFAQPGLGGKDTPVVDGRVIGHKYADAIFPHVAYAPGLERYVMTFCINAYDEIKKGRPEQSGVYFAISADGVCWSAPKRLLRSFAIPLPDREIAIHPTLVFSEGAEGAACGWLYYGYSERWGHAEGRTPHYLVGQPITFRLKAKR